MGPLEASMGRLQVLKSVQRDIETPPSGDGSGNIKDVPSAAGYYEGFAHSAKYREDVFQGYTSGLTGQEFMACRSRLQELMNSPNPEVQEYAKKELGKLNGYVLDREASTERTASIARAQAQYDSALEAYNAGKPSWFAKTFKGAQVNPQLQQDLDYAAKKLELTKCEVVSYETIMRHNTIF